MSKFFPKKRPVLGDILDKDVPGEYVLTPKLWEYLFNYAIKHKAKGNGFGFGLVGPNDVTRTLSARYYKDGSEVLVDRGFNPDKPISDPENQERRPRRLTPRECARLMGYDGPGEGSFKIPVSDTQAYKQFGNSVVVPVFAAVAKLMVPRVLKANEARFTSASETTKRGAKVVASPKAKPAIGKAISQEASGQEASAGFGASKIKTEGQGWLTFTPLQYAPRICVQSGRGIRARNYSSEGRFTPLV